MGQGKKTKCFETLAQSSFANTFPLGLVGELLETKTKIRPKMLQKWDFSCSIARGGHGAIPPPNQKP